MRSGRFVVEQAPLATVTIPVLASMVNRPPALSSRLYVIVLVVASASAARPVIARLYHWPSFLQSYWPSHCYR